MKLMDCELRPGTVISVLDGGKIIASVPGLFSKEDKDKLPPISSFIEGARVNEGDDVWIMNSVSDKMQLHWFKKNNSESRYECSTNKEISKNAQVICNEEYGGGIWAYIIFEDGKGIMIKNNNSYININPSGNIILSNGTTDRTISITPDSISLGKIGKSEHPAAYGDIVEDFAETVVATLKGIQCVTASVSILTPIAQVISKTIDKLETLSQQIKSTNVTLQ